MWERQCRSIYEDVKIFCQTILQVRGEGNNTLGDEENNSNLTPDEQKWLEDRFDECQTTLENSIHSTTRKVHPKVKIILMNKKINFIEVVKNIKLTRRSKMPISK